MQLKGLYPGLRRLLLFTGTKKERADERGQTTSALGLFRRAALEKSGSRSPKDLLSILLSSPRCARTAFAQLFMAAAGVKDLRSFAPQPFSRNSLVYIRTLSVKSLPSFSTICLACNRNAELLIKTVYMGTCGTGNTFKW